ncbi:hypothetical protein DKP78_21410 [Enterococcus faecium]|nr:hypothetical protein DKP78_21410 [Enterococcus faecium]
MGETFLEQLQADSRFLKSDRRLDTEVVDRLILQLNRIYPQVLSDNEAKKNLETLLSVQHPPLDRDLC